MPLVYSGHKVELRLLWKPLFVALDNTQMNQGDTNAARSFLFTFLHWLLINWQADDFSESQYSSSAQKCTVNLLQ